MSKIYYSASSKGFFNEDFHSEIPSDAVEVSEEKYHELLTGECAGDKAISADSDGNPILVDDIKVWTVEEKIANYTSGIQSMLDSTAKEYGYDSISNAITYADEPAVPKFQKEGLAFRAWRSLIWAKSYEILDKFKAGAIAEPTIDEIKTQLPTFTEVFESPAL